MAVTDPYDFHVYLNGWDLVVGIKSQGVVGAHQNQEVGIEWSS